MQRVHTKAFQSKQEALSIGVKVLLGLQVITAILMVLSGIGNVGLAKAIVTHLPTVVSAALILASTRAFADGNEARAHNILSYGLLLIGVSVLVAVRGL